MCGRYVISSPLDVLKQRFQFSGDYQPLPARYNASPRQDLPVIVSEAGMRQLKVMNWGLVPSWTKDITQAQRPINARAETIAEKPSFRTALRKGRILIPMNGFYEWGEIAGSQGKAPYLFRARDGAPMALAGLSETWRGASGETLETFAIVTTEANPLTALVHPRMPVILDPAAEETWLSGPVAGALAVLRSYPEELMEALRVSIRVNAPKNDDPSLVESLGALR